MKGSTGRRILGAHCSYTPLSVWDAHTQTAQGTEQFVCLSYLDRMSHHQQCQSGSVCACVCVCAEPLHVSCCLLKISRSIISCHIGKLVSLFSFTKARLACCEKHLEMYFGHRTIILVIYLINDYRWTVLMWKKV